jgi:hypothetical protein
MLFKIYKSNQTTVLMALPIVALVFWSAGFYHPVQYDFAQSMPLFKLIKVALFDQFWAENLVAISVLVWSAILLVNTLNDNEFYQRTTQFPALLYVVFSSCFLPLLGMHPILFANLFLILAWRRILMIRQQHTVFSELIDGGLLIGIASLFYFPAIFIFPLTWITLFILRSFSWRETIVSIVGFLIPWLFTVVALFLMNADYQLQDIVVLDVHNTMHMVSENSIVNIALLALFSWITLASIYHFSASLMSSVMRGKKLKQVAALSTILFTGGFTFSIFFLANPFFFGLLSIPLSMLFTYYFFHAKSTWLAGLLFYLLIAFLGINLCLQIDLF